MTALEVRREKIDDLEKKSEMQGSHLQTAFPSLRMFDEFDKLIEEDAEFVPLTAQQTAVRAVYLRVLMDQLDTDGLAEWEQMGKDMIPTDGADGFVDASVGMPVDTSDE